MQVMTQLSKGIGCAWRRRGESSSRRSNNSVRPRGLVKLGGVQAALEKSTVAFGNFNWLKVDNL